MSEGTSATSPDDGLTLRQRRLRPALIVNTGPGKGKTTAAMGTALRAWHQGWSIAVFQFVKSGQWKTGERAALEALGSQHALTGAGGPVEWHATGAGPRWMRKPETEAEQAEAARQVWQDLRSRLAAERHRLYVLDEFTYPLTWGWLDIDEVVATLRERPGTQHIVVTGRDAPPELISIATTVTRMEKVAHPFDSGQPGQAGIEW